MIRLKQLRKENNLSQRALAEKLHVSQKAIDLWERGVTEPKASIICALADIFSCSGDYVLGREDELGNVNVMRELNENEKFVLEVFSKLNPENRKELINYAKYMIDKQ